MTRTVRTILLAAGLAAMLAAAPCMAQEPDFDKACAVDIKLQCAGVRPGEGRIRACVREHIKEVSEPCRAVLLKGNATTRACAADVKTHCSDVKRGGGRIAKCLKDHLNDVSAPCRDALKQAAAGKS